MQVRLNLMLFACSPRNRPFFCSQSKGDERTHDEDTNTKLIHDAYVAIKVLTVNATAGITRGLLYEIDAIKRVTTANPLHPGYNHCLKLCDWFVTESIHGPNFCLVTAALADNTATLQATLPHTVFPLPVVKRIIKQILLALDYLHRECGFIHAGDPSIIALYMRISNLHRSDLKADNISLCLGEADVAVTGYLAQHPSESYEPRIDPRVSSDPILTVKSQPLPSFSIDPTLSDIKVQLIDYGHGKNAWHGTPTLSPNPLQRPSNASGRSPRLQSPGCSTPRT
jgi:serine/threonine-protein kinase SRPK3